MDGAISPIDVDDAISRANDPYQTDAGAQVFLDLFEHLLVFVVWGSDLGGEVGREARVAVWQLFIAEAAVAHERHIRLAHRARRTGKTLIARIASRKDP